MAFIERQGQVLFRLSAFFGNEISASIAIVQPMDDDEGFMREAIKEGRSALSKGEVAHCSLLFLILWANI